jgi:hypothetical protein
LTFCKVPCTSGKRISLASGAVRPVSRSMAAAASSRDISRLEAVLQAAW